MSNKHTQTTSTPSKAYLPIEAYGVIGDLYTVALVGTNGSIDWYTIHGEHDMTETVLDHLEGYKHDNHVRGLY